MISTHHNVSRILSHRYGDYIANIFSEETWPSVSMNKTTSAPKRMETMHKSSACYLQMTRVMVQYSDEEMLSKDGSLRITHFESVVEDVKNFMLTPQRLRRSRPKWNSGMAHIFWHMMDEHMHFWYQPEIVCLNGVYERFLEYVYIIFKF